MNETRVPHRHLFLQFIGFGLMLWIAAWRSFWNCTTHEEEFMAMCDELEELEREDGRQ